MKSNKMSYIIYGDLESFIKKRGGCSNNPEKSSTTKIGEHILGVYSISNIWEFDQIKDKHSLYRKKIE